MYRYKHTGVSWKTTFSMGVLRRTFAYSQIPNRERSGSKLCERANMSTHSPYGCLSRGMCLVLSVIGTYTDSILFIGSRSQSWNSK